jgi:hypothetical protein
MQWDLEAASAGRYLAVYDASHAARELAIQSAGDEPPDGLRSATRDGRALLVHIPEDCEARIRVFVDEEPPAAVLAAAHPSRLDASFLAIPSGRLVASAAEDIGSPGSDDADGVRSSAAVPAGSYRLAAFSTFHWKARHRGELLAARTSPAERRLLRAGDALGVMAALFFVGNFFGLPWLAIRAMKHGAWKALGVLLAIDALFVAVAWLGDRFLSGEPRYLAALEVRKSVDHEIPDVVVVLTSGGAPVAERPALLEVPL